ncbi:MAG: protease HtpX [Candidatus Oxydemutatoraceae bacterium WSBS_2016_MAG_OTU14]
MFRIFLFLAVNFAILFVLNIVLTLFGVEHWLHQNGVDFNATAALLIALVFGMGGAFISLALSKKMAKRGMGVKIIQKPSNAREQWLWNIVEKQSQQAGIKMPELGIFPMQQPNAFATGMFRNKALVAVSEGLLQLMEDDEVEAVLGHEMSHVANGDMVTLTLLQGVLNTFVIFLSRAIGHVIDRVVFKSRSHGMGYFITVIVLQIIFSIVASMIVMWFSRYREFHADAGGAKLAGRDKMIRALQRLQSVNKPKDLPDSEFAAFGINGNMAKQGIKRLFLSHPPLDERIAALKQL